MGHSGRVSSIDHITKQAVPPTDDVRINATAAPEAAEVTTNHRVDTTFDKFHDRYSICLLYTSDAADE